MDKVGSSPAHRSLVPGRWILGRWFQIAGLQVTVPGRGFQVAGHQVTDSRSLDTMPLVPGRCFCDQRPATCTG
ncbi:UNVERIFIED_CONTAM: hypothetical protein Sradi_5757700 [Sesamum radiatum]|uniref:Uncharacterized protein n=1 Tax=Sesamum radiatum TaxID=300843 RepID=A0AAW2L4Q7_SESRA